MRMTFSVNFGDSSEIFTSDDLSHYAEEWGLNLYAQDRYSWCFVLDLMLHQRLHGISPHQVMDEIRSLEGHPSQGASTKPASEFRRPPLKGLWHKHYFSARFLPKNIQNQLRGDKLLALIQQICDPQKSPVITEEMINELSHRVTVEQFEQRSEAGALTGEWIVFAKHQGRNFYLCLATHEMGDKKIYEKIKVSCWHQFPFLDTSVFGQAPSY